jgi:hypothetical protein
MASAAPTNEDVAGNRTELGIMTPRILFATRFSCLEVDVRASLLVISRHRREHGRCQRGDSYAASRQALQLTPAGENEGQYTQER